MYSQTIHLTHELKSCIQIIRRRVDFNGDSTVKVPCRRRDSNRDHPTQVLSFAAAPSLQDLAIFMAPHGRAPFKWPVLWGTTFQWSPASSLEHSPDFPRACTPWKRFAAHLLGWYAPATEPGFGFCQQHQEFPSGLPSKYYPGPMLLNFSVLMGTGVSNMARSADRQKVIFSLTKYAKCRIFSKKLENFVKNVLCRTSLTLVSTR